MRRENVKLVFDEAVRAVLGRPSQANAGLVNVELVDADKQNGTGAGTDQQPGLGVECCVIT
jgi:hypothetical protein